MLTPWYVTGFCDGEAAFTYSRNGKGLSLYFAIKANAGDRKLIEQIHDFFGIGKIYVVKPRLPKLYDGIMREAIYYRVTRIAHLEAIIKHFDKYPLFGKKLESYEVWRKMFVLKKNLRKSDSAELQKLALALSGLASKNTSIKKA